MLLLAFGSRSSHGVTVTPGTDEERREGRSPDMPMMARGCTLMARGLAAAADDGGCCCSTSIPESKCFGRARRVGRAVERSSGVLWPRAWRPWTNTQSLGEKKLGLVGSGGVS